MTLSILSVTARRAASLVITIGILGAPASAATVAARVGSVSISRDAVDRAVQQMMSGGAYFHKNLSAKETQRLAIEQLGGLIRRELITFGGLDAGMPLPLEDARTRRRETERQLGKAEYERSIRSNGWTRDEHARVIAKTLLADLAYAKFVAEPAKVTDAGVGAAFEGSTTRWQMPESTHVEHILIRVAPGADANEAERASSRAQWIVEQLATGAAFGDLASKYSADDYRVKGGDLGWVHKGRLLPKLDEAIWNAKPGTVVGPIRSDDGWHVARVVEKRPARRLTFEEAAPVIRKELAKSRIEEREAIWLTQVRQKHPVKILDSSLKPDP